MGQLEGIEMFKKTGLYWRTLKHLKFKQLYFWLYYDLRRRWRKRRGHHYPFLLEREGARLKLQKGIAPVNLFQRSKGTFNFLNLPHRFDDSIDWNFSGHGKLWNYHLNYFDYLCQKDISFTRGLKWIDHFIDHFKTNRCGRDPYPTSRRIVNWIKFITRYRSDFGKRSLKLINASLYSQVRMLLGNLEYHLMANHLLENGFALFFAACYFSDQKLYRRAEKLLRAELGEQILADGGHFERSLMYHQELLHRILDCINLAKSNPEVGETLSGLLRTRAAAMLGWLRQMTFRDGRTPLFKDSAGGIAPSSGQLWDYAGRLGVNRSGDPKPVSLGESGYRRASGNRYEIIVDMGEIGPAYNPGHGHCDIFSFEMNAYGQAVIVDTGISSYEDLSRRTQERMTSAHNTVRVSTMEQSEIWGRFRVGRRARVRNLAESGGYLDAEHTGFLKIGALHRRRFTFTKDRVIIKDVVSSRKPYQCTSYLHFHPDIRPYIKGDRIRIQEFPLTIVVKNFRAIRLQDGYYASAFNQTSVNRVAVIEFTTDQAPEMTIRIPGRRRRR